MKATIHYSGRGWLVAINNLAQPGEHQTLDLAIRAVHGLGCEVVGVHGTTGGVRFFGKGETSMTGYRRW